MNLLCPNCRCPIEVVENPLQHDVLCPSCGSSFRVEAGSTQAFLPAKRIGKFEIQAQVGIGAFGTVYRARDPELDRPVAIKVPRAGNLDSAGGLDRFLREARSVAQLRHPSIVRVHDVGQHEGTAFLVSDFVEGITLGDFLTARRPSFQESATLMAQVADALQYAHEHGVVHRDVKPSNIMLEVTHDSATGDAAPTAGHAVRPTYQPKLMDFGLAKRDAGEVTMTMDGQVLGTPAYMSPEQARGQAHAVDGRTDVYSLGVIFYQLLTGELPFRGNTQMLLFQVIHEEPKPPRTLNHRIPRDLETICLKSLEKDRERRYPSAAALVADLRRWLAGEPIRARPAGRIERAVKWVRRRPALAGLIAVTAVAAVVVVGLGLAVYEGRLRQSEAETRRLGDVAEEERRGRQRVEDEAKNTARQLYTAQLWRAAGLWQRAPQAARSLLEDNEICRPELRDFAWAYYHRLCDRERGRLEGHGSEIMALALAPDGTTLASTDADGTVKLWDLRSNRLLRNLEGHRGGAWSVVFSKDGSNLYTGGADRLIRKWDVGSGAATGTLEGHGGDVAGLALAPDGKQLASVSFARDPDERNGDLRLKRGELKLWDLESGQSRQLFSDASSGLLCVAWSPSGNLVAAGHSHGSQIRVWDVRGRGGRASSTLSGGGWIQGMAFSPDGKTLALARSDNSIRVCAITEAADGGTPYLAEQAILTGHLDEAMGVAFTPDQSLLVSTATDATVRIWDLATSSERAVFHLAQRGPGGDTANHPILLADGGREIIVGQGNVVSRWSLPGRGRGISLQQRQVQALAVSPDGKTLAAGSTEEGVKLWALTAEPLSRSEGGTGQLGRLLPEDPTTVPTASLAYSRDGRLLAAAGLDREAGRLTLWPTQGGRPIVLSTPSPLTAVNFNRDGSLVYAAGPATEIYSWDLSVSGVAKPRPTIRFSEAQDDPRIHALAPMRDGERLLLVSGSGIREIEPGRDSSSWVRADAIGAAALSPTEERVAIAVRFIDSSNRVGNAVSIADVRTGEQRVSMTEVPTEIRALAFSPDGRTLAGGGADRTVRLWDAATGQLRAHLDGHHREVAALAFTPDGRMLVSAADTSKYSWFTRGEIKLWAAGPDANAWTEFEQDVEDFDQWYRRGRVLATQGEWEQAVRAYDAAVARRPFHGRAIFEYRAVALHRLGHFARAAADYAQALHYQPDWTHLLWCRAVMLVLAGDAEAHQHLCRAALDRYENGGSAGALFDIARTCSLAPLPLIEARRALKLAERAVADSPNTSWYQRTLATCHLRAGQPEEAIRLHTASAEGSTLSRTLRWLPLALAHHQIGEGDQARAWHEKAAALIDAAVRDMPKEASGPADVHPNDWLEIQALYREAATLLAAGPPKRAP